MSTPQERYEQFWNTATPEEPKNKIMKGTCEHRNGTCDFMNCPKCHKHTLHLYQSNRNLRVVNVAECECGYYGESKIMGMGGVI